MRLRGALRKVCCMKRLLLSAAVILLATFGWVGCGGSSNSDQATTASSPTTTTSQTSSDSGVTISLAEFTLVPKPTGVANGKVTFNVKNNGRLTHEMVVIRTKKPAADLLQGSRASESGSVGEAGEIKPGRQKTVSFKLKPGHYALICNLPGHYKAGQHADFNVR
jgi:uncharacterized cupredoxin-like copper-binding protein